jgi:DNA sulfur modification protein DndE
VDTLYGFGFLDVSQEPLILHVPDTQDRYYSIHLIDAYQNSVAYVGCRATGTKEGEYAVTAPGWTGSLPPGVTKIESPTRHLLALTRTHVRSEQDLPAAQCALDRLPLPPAHVVGPRPVACIGVSRLPLRRVDVEPPQNRKNGKDPPKWPGDFEKLYHLTLLHRAGVLYNKVDHITRQTGHAQKAVGGSEATP